VDRGAGRGSRTAAAWSAAAAPWPRCSGSPWLHYGARGAVPRARACSAGRGEADALRVRGPGRKRSTRRGGSAAVAHSGEVAHVTERERTSGKGTGGFLTSTRSSGGGPRCRRRSGNEDSTAAEASSRRQWRRCLIPRVSRRGKETRVLGGGAGGCGVCFIGWGGSAILDSRAARTSGPVVAADSETAGGRG
jgi:hypothetical protein